MNNCHQFAFFADCAQCMGTHLDVIGTRLQVIEDDTGIICALVYPFATINAVLISDVLIVHAFHTQLQSKVIIGMTHIQSATIINQSL